MTRLTCTVISIAAVGFSAEAWADDGHRFELDFAFLAGARSYDDVPFSYREGDATPALASPRFRGVAVTGPSFGARAVIRNVRVGFGYERPYARGFDRQPLATAAGSSVPVRALSSTAYRFALGYEIPLGSITPFVDLIGTAETTDVDLLAGDAQSTFDSRVFGYSLQVGARVPFSRHWFLQLSGEAGAVSPIDWSAHAGVGVSLY
jgi:hypothetical protein